MRRLMIARTPLSYAVLRPATSPTEPENARVLMIMDSAEEAEAIAAELRGRGMHTEIRTAVGAGMTLRLAHR